MTAHSHPEAAVEAIVGALRSHRVLSRSALADAVHAASWPDRIFAVALHRALVSGRVVDLGEGIYEIAESEKIFPRGDAA